MIFKHASNGAINVIGDDGQGFADLLEFKDGTFICLSRNLHNYASTSVLNSDDLREIADKLDELNKS